MAKPSIVKVLEFYNFEGLVDWGGWRPVRCVFHGERRASASYNPEENKFKCFACHMAGDEGQALDAWDVVRKAEGVSLAEAQQRVQAITGDDGGLVSRGTGGGSRLPLWARERLLGKPGSLAGCHRALSAGRGRRLAS